MEGLSSCSMRVSNLNNIVSDANNSSANFCSRSTCMATVKSSQINRQQLPHSLTSSLKNRLLETSKDSEQCLTNRFQKQQFGQMQSNINKEQKVTKELENIIFHKFRFSIRRCKRSKTKLLHIAVCLINQIKNQVNPVELCYYKDEFKIKNRELNESIKEEDLSRSQLTRKKQRLLLNEIAKILNVNFTRVNPCSEILSAACDYLNDYLKRAGIAIEEVSENRESPSDTPVNSTPVKRDLSKIIKFNKETRIKKNNSSKELEDILFCKLGVNIDDYRSSKIKLIDATIFIIKQIKGQVEPINLVYDLNYFRERSTQVASTIEGSGLSRYQVIRRKHNILLNELKAVLDIDAAKDVDYEQILSEACNYLNDYLNQTSDTTADFDDDVIHVPGSTQLVKSQPLSQSSMPSTGLHREEELTIAEQSALIRLKNALNRYPIPQIDIDNFSELIFAAAYCTKMNSDMMLVSELDYNQHYLKHFHAPDPFNNPRDEIEYYLGDLEKILSEESMDLAIDQYLNHQKETLPETGCLENTEFDSCIDAFEPEALPTTDSFNLPLENLEDEASSARANKISAALDLAAQYLENEEYIELQNLPANEDLPTYEDLSIYEDSPTYEYLPLYEDLSKNEGNYSAPLPILRG